MTHDDLLGLDPAKLTGAFAADSPSDSSVVQKNSETKSDQEKLILVKQVLEKVQKDLDRAFKVLAGAGTAISHSIDYNREAQKFGKITEEANLKIIEGVFDGQNMIGPDGKQYSVPSNYASKSKLVEGDILKLTIEPNGAFVYKQIGPKEREHLKGVLIKDEDSGDFRVLADGRKYKVILASVTYFKGEEGDEVAILVPQEKNSAWAAVENIIKNQDKKDINPKSSSIDSKIYSLNLDV